MSKKVTNKVESESVLEEEKKQQVVMEKKLKLSDIILIVEYDRDALDEHGEKIRPTNCESSIKVAGKCPALTETYIASLEWEYE